LKQLLTTTFLTLVVSFGLVALTTLCTVKSGKFSAIPENLNYEFLAQQNPLVYSTWSQPATSNNVEQWQLTLYGYPETFLHICKGLTTAGQYVMIDWHRLLFNCILGFVVSLIIVMGIKKLYAGFNKKAG